MRKLLNDPEAVVKESLAGLAAAHGDILRVRRRGADRRARRRPGEGKVALVSGGGSGHEPLHGGFVGLGMLDAACPGEVFTSPVPDQMLAATKAVDGGAGVVHIVKNYTGDVMNFKLAAEDAADEGIDVESVLIDDDVAVQDSLYTAGRRGVGATVLAEKIAGAAAERGDDVAAVAGIARRVNERSRSFGVALSSCIPPAAGKPIFDLPAGEIEVGIGIHGEPGRRREALGDARAQMADVMVEAVVSDLGAARGAKVLPFVNGMGGTPLLELYLLYGEIERGLKAHGLEPVREPRGAYITSLEMAGASLTLLELDDELTAAVGCSRPHRRAALGGVSADGYADRRGPRAVSRRLDERIRRRHRGGGRSPDAAGLGDRRRRPRGQHDARVRAPCSRRWRTSEDGAPGKLLILAGKTLVSTVGGASGPLWGTALRRARARARRRGEFDGPGARRRARRRARGRPGARRGRAGRQDDGRRARPGGGDAARAARGRRRAGRGASPRPPTRPRRAPARPRRCRPARAAPRISASAPSATRTRARRRPH